MKMKMLLVWLALASGAWAGQLEDVISKHIEARGGMQAWKAIDSITYSGDYTSFSEVSPFTMTITSNHELVFDHTMINKRILLGGSGEKFWWINNLMGFMPADMPPAEVVVARQWTDIATPFFDYQGQGHKVEYLGEEELDGTPGLALKLTRADGTEETWYLDPETHLEMARVAQGADFGRAMPQVTWFLEFREAAGLMIPHMVESTFGTRYRVLEIKKVTINNKPDPLSFVKPNLSFGMQPLANLVGNWKVKVTVNARGGPQESETTSVITPKLSGAIFNETMTVTMGGEPIEVERTWSHDGHREHYTLISIDSNSGLANILNGQWQEDTLVLDNLKSDTTSDNGGGPTHTKITLSNLSADGFTQVQSSSRDGGKQWRDMTTLVYTRVE